MSGVAGWKSTDPAWSDVDALIEDKLLEDDPVLAAVLERSAAAGLPDIAVSAAQGKFLSMLVAVSGAKRILEIGTLGGYSTIWLARGGGQDVRVTTLEFETEYAKVARENLALADLAEHVDVIEGEALASLETLTGPFDFTFIDADKVNNCAYVDYALRLSRSGALIVVDNVVRGGQILAPEDESAIGTRALYEHLRGNQRLDATALQTVGAKGWDGLLLAVVR